MSIWFNQKSHDIGAKDSMKNIISNKNVKATSEFRIFPWVIVQMFILYVMINSSIEWVKPDTNFGQILIAMQIFFIFWDMISGCNSAHFLEMSFNI